VISGALGGVVNAYGAMLSGAFGDPGRIITALQTGKERDIATAIRPSPRRWSRRCPSSSPASPWRFRSVAGMSNIGGDGQLMIGALGATITAILLAGQVPSPVILIAALTVATLAGGFWGFIPGFLKGAHGCA